MGSIFGTRGGGESSSDGRASARRGIDVEVDIRLSFDQAMTGVSIPVAFDRRELCSTCSGSGAKAGTAPRLCPECKGRGVRGRDAGSFALSEPCTRCSGNGTVIDDPCGECSGRGTIARSARERVRIPAGVRDGTRVRKKGRGQSGARGGPAGDLIAVTRVSDSRLFSRKDDDLVVQVPVTFAEAALGGEVEVPTIDGRVKLVVPPGCHDGRSLRVSGHGAPRLKGGGRGDLIARLRIQVPRELSEEQQRALKEFASLDDRDPRETLFS
jgi:molecular chaperone DnaJ